MKYCLFMPAFILLTSACDSSDSSETIVATTESVTLNFSASAGEQTIACDQTLTGLGTTAVEGTIRDFRLYLHDIVLKDASGTEYPLTLDSNNWQSPEVALLDFQDKSDNCSGEAKDTRKIITGSIASGVSESITSVSFKLGIPEALNHENQAAAATPLNITGLFWSWQGGYKFARIDFAPSGGLSRPDDSEFSGTSFNFHLGSSSCVGDAEQGESVSCGLPNRAIISLDEYALSSTINLDYAELVSEVTLNSDTAGAPGCMSGSTDPECLSIFPKLALDIETGESSAELTQTVFSVK